MEAKPKIQQTAPQEKADSKLQKIKDFLDRKWFPGMENVKYTTGFQSIENNKSSSESIPIERKSPIFDPGLEQLNALLSGEKSHETQPETTKPSTERDMKFDAAIQKINDFFAGKWRSSSKARPPKRKVSTESKPIELSDDPSLEQLKALFSGEKMNDIPNLQTKEAKSDIASEAIPPEKLQGRHTVESAPIGPESVQINQPQIEGSINDKPIARPQTIMEPEPPKKKPSRGMDW